MHVFLIMKAFRANFMKTAAQTDLDIKNSISYFEKTSLVRYLTQNP